MSGKRLRCVCEVAKAVVTTPIGQVSVTGCDIGVHKISLTAANETLPPQNEKHFEICEEPISWKTSVRLCCDWLEKYFTDVQSIIDLPLPPLHVTEFKQESFSYRIWQKLASDVHPGETVTYGELAAMLGNPKGARAVGGAMRLNPTPLVVPCHRVTASGGKIGGFMSGKGIPVKQWLLQHEGVSL